MSRFKEITLIFTALLVTALLFTGVYKLQMNMDRTIDESHLRFSGQVKDAPLAVTFASMALGSFRGLIADMLWLRSENLKNKKSYFEMVQLARWITDLQPNYSGGTAYLAWNLAYNVSVTSSDPADRWRWVNEGVVLIRDKALLYNPDDPVLYKELAWIFSHKMGNVLDDANMYYKAQLAKQVTQVTGGENFDLAGMVAAPKTEAGFRKLFPAEHRLWSAAAAENLPDYAAIYQDFKNRTPAALPPVVVQKLPETEWKQVDAHFRARLLRERLKLEPEKMLAVNNRYGRMDWRVPESQAIYWALEGVERSKEHKDLNCARIITQSLQAAFRGGRLLIIDESATNEYVQVAPNLQLADAAYQTYLDTQNAYDGQGNVYSSFRSARINFLKDAIPLIYTYGDLKKAEEFFKLLIKEDGMQKQRTLDEFVMVEFAEDVRDADVKKASAVITGLIRRSVMLEIYGEHDAALANERLARYIYRNYVNANKEVKRNALPPYKQMKLGVITEARESLPPVMRRLLEAAIAAEKEETVDAAVSVQGDAK